MANTTSDLITNLLAATPTKNAVGASGARLRYKRASAVSVSGDGAGHLYPMLRMRAHDRLESLKINNTADAGWTDMNVGVYAADAAGTTSAGDWSLADQVAIDADILVDGANRAAASAGPDELLGTGTNAYAETLEGAPLWQVAGVATEPAPGTEYDIVVQSIGNPAGGGTLVMTIAYSADN